MSTHPLPSRVAPSSRSRSAGRPSRDESSDKTHARSTLPSTPRLSSSKSGRSGGYPRPSRDKPDTMRTNSSSTASSTSSSSFLDRMNAPSSRTSIEDDQVEPARRGGGGWASPRGKRAVQAEEEQSDEEDRSKGPTASIEGYGYDLWSRVTTVASNLTVNVSQAWQKSVLFDGEETPPGQDSRLTKAMKAYHLDRARSPADLPTWLFTEQERGVAPKAWETSTPRDSEDRFLADRFPEPRQRGGLRDVYDQAAASSSSTPAARWEPAAPGDGGGSRATDRLKAIRDAKRSAKSGSEAAQSPSEDRQRDTTTSRVGELYPSGGPRPRVGLPAGPGRMRR